MRVALFTHNFLEPTHHAIAQLMGAMNDCRYSVFAKRFEDHFALSNVVSRTVYTKGPLPQLTSAAFDLVHAIYDGKTAIRAHQASTSAGLPFVLSFHGGFDVHAKIHDVRYREASRAICEAASAITVPCAQDRDLLHAIGVSRVAEVLPVPVVTGVRRHERRPDPHRLLLVGRLVPKKGIDTAIRAMSELPGYQLEVIGEGELEVPLRSLVERLGLIERVRLCGYLPLAEVEQRMLRAFALLHPARVAADGNAEGTAQVVLHAQALGLPVIATATGSLGWIVRHGKTGLLVPSDNPSVLAATVRSLATNSVLQQALADLPEPADRRVGAVAEQLRGIYAAVAREADSHD